MGALEVHGGLDALTAADARGQVDLHAVTFDEAGDGR